MHQRGGHHTAQMRRHLGMALPSHAQGAHGEQGLSVAELFERQQALAGGRIGDGLEIENQHQDGNTPVEI